LIKWWSKVPLLGRPPRQGRRSAIAWLEFINCQSQQLVNHHSLCTGLK
jgi:hypothetical protein